VIFTLSLFTPIVFTSGASPNVTPSDFRISELVTSWSNFTIYERPPEKSTPKLSPLVASEMTPEQLAETQKLAREWKPTNP